MPRICLHRFCLLGTLLLCGTSCNGASTTAPAQGDDPSTTQQALTAPPAHQSLFDPARHMRVSEVRPGMTGYGLSVFQGTKIERFDVEVISVLHNFNPQYDVVLIRCHGANLEHTGAIAGMSGSPIYLTDEQGRSRLIGAFAYGWSLMKDPLAGVQPIEYMLDVGSTLRVEPAATQASEPASSEKPSSRKPRRLFQIDPRAKSCLQASSNVAQSRLSSLAGDGAGPQLAPLATPLMASGLSPKLMDEFAPALKSAGLVPMQAGGISASANPSTQPAAQIEPGSVLAAPMMTGDVELTAIGTCTEVIGDRVFGFGHPFNNEGPITLPMGAGEINGVIASVERSFKLGAMTQLRGTLIADQSVGVAGRLGKSPPTIPISIRVIYEDGSLDTTYHFQTAAHPRLTSMLAGMAVQAALSGRRDLPQYHTVEYELKMKFANGREVDVNNVTVNNADRAVGESAVLPISLAADNPFERVLLKEMSGTVRVRAEAHQADLLSVNLPKKKYKPGETVKASVRYRPFRSGETVMPVELELPRDLRDGTYHLSIADQSTYIQQEQTARPFRFSAEDIDDVFDVLQDASSIRQDALYVTLLRQADGIAIGRTAMPLLPSSRRQVLMDAGRSNVTPFVSSELKVVPTQFVMNGSADFEIEISSEDRIEGAAAAGNKPPAKPGSETTPRPEAGGKSAAEPTHPHQPAPQPAPGPHEPAPNPSEPPGGGGKSD